MAALRRLYTQDEIREIVAYASELGIEVIPEIDLPGHTTAMLAAYPHLACFNGDFQPRYDWGVFPDILCAGNDELIGFLDSLLQEIAALFPSPYIHLGGDEAPKERWKACPKCQSAYMNSNYGMKRNCRAGSFTAWPNHCSKWVNK
jgi:hexosaminidase